MKKFRFDNIDGQEERAIEILQDILRMQTHPNDDERGKVSQLTAQLYHKLPKWRLKQILLDGGYTGYICEIEEDEDTGERWFVEYYGRKGFDDEAFYEVI